MDVHVILLGPYHVLCYGIYIANLLVPYLMAMLSYLLVALCLLVAVLCRQGDDDLEFTPLFSYLSNAIQLNSVQNMDFFRP